MYSTCNIIILLQNTCIKHAILIHNRIKNINHTCNSMQDRIEYYNLVYYLLLSKTKNKLINYNIAH